MMKKIPVGLLQVQIERNDTTSITAQWLGSVKSLRGGHDSLVCTKSVWLVSKEKLKRRHDLLPRDALQLYQRLNNLPF